MSQINEPDIFVLLMGGLGNQLFQASAGTYYGSATTYLVSDLANATKGANGKAEIFEFALPDRVKEYKFEKVSYFTQKLINYSIRVSTKKRTFRHAILENALSLLISKNVKRKIFVRISDDIGYSNTIRKSENTLLIIGYFQSWKYARTLIDSCNNRKLELASKTSNFSEAITRIPDTNWRLVHIRLGDYLSNGDFGLLSPAYFNQQIELQNKEQSMQTLVFTNDKEKLAEMNPFLAKYASNLDEGLSSAELLVLCSYATNFIISNSTFSWWAAYISGHGGINVVAPQPWFRYTNSPMELAPPHWVRSAPIYLDLK